MSEPDDLRGRAFLLSNGAVQAISDGPSWAHSVYVSGSDFDDFGLAIGPGFAEAFFADEAGVAQFK